ncbi:MAG: CarD family transcriptional regulator [Actinomycetaceae bacterium]|nr:CarD family transcriptional regulator [Actinomycetaceae bacterium]
MSFEIGQTVVYPHHGAATIEEISTRTIRGEDKTYLTLRVSQGDLTIQVPAENVDLVGVRDVVDEDGLEEVLAVLRAPYIEEPTNWSRRYKANQEKIATGDIVKVSEVVRDLTRRDDQKKLSTGEKRMLTKARQILTSELALARGIDKAAAAIRLDQILEEGRVDFPDEETEAGADVEDTPDLEAGAETEAAPEDTLDS